MGRSVLGGLVRVGAVCVLLLGAARGASAQPAPPQVDQNCTVSVLNRTVTQNADGSWVLPNVPANFGPVRARATCVVNGQTVSGESDPFVVTPNGIVNLPPVRFGQTTPIPTSLNLITPTGTLTAAGATARLTVMARYSDGSTKDVTAASNFTQYTVSNSAIAAVTAEGLVQAVTSGTVLLQATHEGTSGMTSMRVILAGVDTDGDGIPDDVEVALGMNPGDPVDAMEDFDRDGLTNLREYQLGTDIRKTDTDSDGLRDDDETTRGTNPLIRDTDGDGISDGLEVQTSSNPLDPASYNLPGALTSIAVTPASFNLTFNTIVGDAWAQLRVMGALRDNTTLDITSTTRGTTYTSSNLPVCSFQAGDGRVHAGVSGGCTVTARVGTFSAISTGTVTAFAPTARSSVLLGGPGNGVDVAGDFVYVAAGGAGLKVVDVTNRSAPHVAATLLPPGTANDVKLAGTRAFVAAGSAGLIIVDVSNPSSPALLGYVDTPGSANDVRVRGNLAFVADSAAGLQIIDVADATAPRIVGSVATGANANGVDIAGNFAIVAVGAVGIRVINVADPFNPTVVATLDTPGDARDVLVNGSYAYVADHTGSLRAVNISNPAAPVLGGTTLPASGGVPVDLAVADRFVFGTDASFNFTAVPIVDVDDFTTLRPSAILNFGGAGGGVGIAVDGSHVYLGTDQGRLHIGQYRLEQDLNGVPPSVTISSPVSGGIFVEGETIPVTVTATDDLGVRGVTLQADGATVATDTTAPYQFNVTAPVGATSLVLGAQAGDFGNNTGTAADVVVNLIPDPLTTVTGRVVLQNGTPAGEATVSCLSESSLTLADGTFAIPGVRTAQRRLACVALLMSDGLTQRGVSAMAAAVRGGTTDVGDIVLGPIPIITSITPRIIDSSRPPPSTLHVTGLNLTGAVFAFAPVLNSPAPTAGTAQINADGTSATLPVTVAATARGRFTLVGTSAFGGSDATPAPGNTLILLNALDDVDSDGDGFPDGLELQFGSDSANASSTPDFTTNGDVTSRAVSVVNTTFSFAVPKSSTQWFSVLNKTFPFAVPKSSTQWFSVLNTSLSLLGQTVVSPSVSILNLPANLFAPQQSLAAANQLQLAGAGSAPLAIGLDGISAERRMIAGQTLIVGASVSGADGTETVSFSINGTAFAADSVAPYTMTFTVPAGVSELTFDATVRELAGQAASAGSLTIGVDPDTGASVSGRVVDGQGAPVVNAIVELLSEGLRAEFFDSGTPLTVLPELVGATATRSTRVTAINTRGPGGLFGPDPLGTGLAPDYAGRFTGWLLVTTAGSQTFSLGVDKGARLKVGGVTLIDMPNPAPGGFQESSGAVDLPAGLVPVEITFYQSTGNAELQLSFTPPGGKRQVVPPSMLVAAVAPLVAVTDGDGRFTLRDVPMALENARVRVTSPAGDVVVGDVVVTVPVAGPLSGTGVDVGDVVLPRRP